MICRCAGCNARIEVTEDQVDGPVECPHCGVRARPFRIKEEPSTKSSAAETAPTTTAGGKLCRCAGCNGLMEVPAGGMGAPVECPRCGTRARPFPAPADASASGSGGGPKDRSTKRQPDPAAAEQAAARRAAEIVAARQALAIEEQAVRSLAAGPQGDLRAGCSEARFSLTTKVTLGTVLACAAAAWLLWGNEWAGVAAAILGVLVGVVLVAAMGRDLSIPSVSGRTAPQAGLRFFLRALGAGRPGLAWWSLGPVGREELAPDELRDEWRPVLHDAGGAVTASRFRVLEEKGDLALAACDLSWRVDPDSRVRVSGGLLGGAFALAEAAANAERHSLEITKLLRRVDGQWYVLSGLRDSPKDRAFEEAVRVAEMDDADLAALVRGGGPGFGEPESEDRS